MLKKKKKFYCLKKFIIVIRIFLRYYEYIFEIMINDFYMNFLKFMEVFSK